MAGWQDGAVVKPGGWQSGAVVSPPVGTGEDMARGGWGGLVQGAVGMLNAGRDAVFNNQSVPAPLVSQGEQWAAQHIVAPLAQMITGASPDMAKSVASSVMSRPDPAAVPGGGYQAKTLPGKFVQTTATMAPAAVGGEASIPQRVANVVVPGLTSETFGQIAEAMHAPGWAQQAARFIGAMGGGVAANARIAPTEGAPKTVASVDPAAEALPGDQALRMHKYIRSLAGEGPKSPPGSPGADQMTFAETLGKPAQIALGSAAQRPGATGDALGALIEARQMARPENLMASAERATGIAPGDAAGTIQAVVDAGRTKAAPQYAAAYAQPLEMTPELAALAEKPAIQTALDHAANLIKNDPEITPAEAASIQAAGPQSMRLWDYAKRALDDQISGITDPITGRFTKPTEGGILTRLGTNLRDTLRDANPAYGEALDTAGDYLSVQQAFRDGAKLFANPNITEKQFADYWKGLSSGEQQGAVAGISNKAFDLAQNNRLKPASFSTPRMQAKLAIAIGQDRAQQLTQDMQTHADMANFERTQGPNTGAPTYGRAAAGADQDALSGGPGDAILARLVRSGGSIKGAIRQTATEKAAEALLNRKLGAQVPVRDEFGRIMLLPPQQGADYLNSLGPAPNRQLQLRVLPPPVLR